MTESKTQILPFKANVTAEGKFFVKNKKINTQTPKPGSAYLHTDMAMEPRYSTIKDKKKPTTFSGLQSKVKSKPNIKMIK